jgi:hypothetical protein
MEEILSQHGKAMIAVLEPVWEKQVQALRGFMEGKTDKFCRRGMGCGRAKNRSSRGGSSSFGGDRCNLAHSDAEMIPQVLWALRAVDVRSRDRLMGFER